MAVIDKAFRTDAISLDDDILLSHGSADPSEAPGVEAPIGSFYFRTDGTQFHKLGPDDTDWVKMEDHNDVIETCNSYGDNMVRNFNGALGEGENYHSSLVLDRATRPPVTPASFTYTGYRNPHILFYDKMRIDPNATYLLSGEIYQHEVPGIDARYRHFLYLRGFDVDGFPLNNASSSWFVNANTGVSSVTTLTQPLTPGDTVVHVADVSGWNNYISTNERGIIIREYRDSYGHKYKNYSRYLHTNLFDPLTAIDTNNNTITLTTPIPNGMANPDDPNGTWPVGTELANTTFHNIGTYQYLGLKAFTPPATNTWYKFHDFVATDTDMDRWSRYLFQDGVAYVRLGMLANFTNVEGQPNATPDAKVSIANITLTKADTFNDGNNLYFFDRSRLRELSVDSLSWNFTLPSGFSDNRELYPNDDRMNQSRRYHMPHNGVITGFTAIAYKNQNGGDENIDFEILINDTPVGGVISGIPFVQNSGNRSFASNESLDIPFNAGDLVVVRIKYDDGSSRWRDLIFTMFTKRRTNDG